MSGGFCKEVRREFLSWIGFQTLPSKLSIIAISTTNVEAREVRAISGYQTSWDYNQMALSGMRRHNSREKVHLLAEGI